MIYFLLPSFVVVVLLLTEFFFISSSVVTNCTEMNFALELAVSKTVINPIQKP